VLKDNMDYSTAMFDGSGKLAAQGLTLPGHFVDRLPQQSHERLGLLIGQVRGRHDLYVGRLTPQRDARANGNRSYTSTTTVRDSVIEAPVLLLPVD
jgi:hypothetical protein